MTWLCAGHSRGMAYKNKDYTFDHFDPLQGLNDIIAMDTDAGHAAMHVWFQVHNVWIGAVIQKARLAHSPTTSGIDHHRIDKITGDAITTLIQDCIEHPEKAEYIGSLEHAILSVVDREVLQIQAEQGITTSRQNVHPTMTRGGPLDTIRQDLARDYGRPATRAEIVAEYYVRTSEQ